MIINVDNKIVNNQNNTIISLTNNCGLKATFMSLGAAIYSCSVTKSNGEEVELLVVPEKLEDFYHDDFYFGKTIGRVAGRINNGILKFEGKQYELDKNWKGINNLHGGFKGVSTQNFEYEFLAQNKYWDITFRHKVLENNDGIPGNVNLSVVYRVYDRENKIVVIYNYIANRSTVCSFTNHACFNLNGNKGDALKHKLMINASKFMEVDENLIPVRQGKCAGVMNFTKPREIGEQIEDSYLQNSITKGYDHPFLLNTKNSDETAAVLENDDGSISLTLKTSYPSLVLYTDNYPTKFKLLKGGKDQKYKGVCLEPSFVPNSCNLKNPEGIYIEGRKLYTQLTEYIFEVK